MKTVRMLLVLSIALTLIAVVGPAQAQDGIVVDGESGGTLSCNHYATQVSHPLPNVSPGDTDGRYGPFAEGIYTFTVTATGGSVTFRIVGDSTGSPTLAGPFTTPATVSISIGEQPKPGMGYYIDSVNPGPQSEVVTVTVAVSCGTAGCDAQVNIPPQAVVGSFVTNAAAYWEPGQLITNPPVTIEAGKTYWVAGQDATGMYRKVLLGCQWVWVLHDTVGPNYDDVWQGKPLPTDVVD
jgi:hypothetical protein